MRWKAVVHSLEDEIGVLFLEFGGDSIQVPIKYLPAGCRVGDVLQLNVSFDPFETLNWLQESSVKKD